MSFHTSGTVLAANISATIHGDAESRFRIRIASMTIIVFETSRPAPQPAQSCSHYAQITHSPIEPGASIAHEGVPQRSSWFSRLRSVGHEQAQFMQ